MKEAADCGMRGRIGRVSQFIAQPSVIVWLSAAALTVVARFVSKEFLMPRHLLIILRQASGLGILAMGQTIVMFTGGVDLSNGMVVTLVNVVAATMLSGSDDLIVPVIIIALGIGAVVGAANGLIVTKLRISPFVGTLGTYSILRGAAYVYTNGAPKGAVSPFLRFIGNGYVGIVPTTVVAWVGITVIVIVVINNIPFGRYLFAVGSNPRTARLSGVRVHAVTGTAYVLSGIISSAAGLLMLGYIGTGSLSLGDDYNLNSLAAAVLGGTPLTGGAGSLVGSAGGTMFLSVLFSLLRFLGLEFRNQLIVHGAVLIVALFLYSRSK